MKAGDHGKAEMMTMLMKLSSLFQTLGFAPDFVHAAIAPYINDIHRKGAPLTSCLLWFEALL